jgi:hypothetical protein
MFMLALIGLSAWLLARECGRKQGEFQKARREKIEREEALIEVQQELAETQLKLKTILEQKLALAQVDTLKNHQHEVDERSQREDSQSYPTLRTKKVVRKNAPRQH